MIVQNTDLLPSHNYAVGLFVTGTLYFFLIMKNLTYLFKAIAALIVALALTQWKC